MFVGGFAALARAHDRFRGWVDAHSVKHARSCPFLHVPTKTAAVIQKSDAIVISTTPLFRVNTLYLGMQQLLFYPIVKTPHVSELN
jgi:hypothetical protein